MKIPFYNKNVSFPFLFKRVSKILLRQFLLLKSDSLYRNAFWLMAGTIFMSGIGFVYWIVAARLYTATEIGLVVTFTSAITLISSFSTLGFNTTLVRFLPASKNKEKLISTSFSAISIASLFFGGIFLLGLPTWSNKLVFLRENLLVVSFILLFFPINTLSMITGNVFTALRESYYVFLSNVLQSLVKFLSLILLFSFGMWGLLSSVYFSTLAALIFSVLIIVNRYKIKINLQLDKEIIVNLFSYTFSNYLISFIGAFPGYVLPLIVTSKISPESTAFFYMPNMIASLLSIFPSTISRSYFSESAHQDKPTSFKKPMFVCFSILIPIVITLILLGHYILQLFGKNYAAEGYVYLSLVSLSVLISVPGFFFGTRLLVKRKMRKLILLSVLGATSDIILVLLFTGFGIVGVGVAVVLGQFQGTLFYLLDYLFYK